MEIRSAEFVMSNTRIDHCPQTGLPEYAFIGRSNVGKSSLINMLTHKPKLAMTSATPGKTMLINHFISWIFSSISPPKKNGVCLLYCFVLSPLISLGAVPHHHLALSVKEFTYSSNS